jgi:serine/threonine-protein kinase
MKQIGGYEIIEKIGSGGMGSVYRGRQVSLDRPVAIKVLSRKLTDCREVLERFNRESRIIARLNHPNIIHVIDRGVTSGGMPYFVMEHIEGTDLSQEIKAGNLDTNRKIDLMIQVSKALSYAHKNGVIHRDIKPGNVLIDGDGNALVLDFGIAKLSGNGKPSTDHTEKDVIMGTVDYMSPEQRTASHRVTAASDLYSMGAMMYELFTGIKPLGRFRPPSALEPSIPESLEEIILRCLEPQPKDRFSSADEVKDRLLQVLQGAHLPSAQKERAQTGLSSVGEKFALLDVIKENDYGAVYLYQDRIDQRLMVIKKRVKTTAGLGEAKILTNLKHKNIVNILGVSGDERLFIIVMEYLSGGALKDRLVRSHPWVTALKIVKEIASGISFAHRNRIIHGNLRPSNILFAESGQIKITDFGLDEHYLSSEEGENWYSVSGTPKSFQGDIFAIGVILYQLLTGMVPVWEDKKLAPHNPFNLLPVKLQKMVTRMVSCDEAIRYNSVDEVIVDIQGILAAYEEKKRQEKLRQAQMQAAKAAALQAPRYTLKRLVPTFVLLALLTVSALIYLDYTGRINLYAQAIPGMWEELTTHLGSLIGNR